MHLLARATAFAVACVFIGACTNGSRVEQSSIIAPYELASAPASALADELHGGLLRAVISWLDSYFAGTGADRAGVRTRVLAALRDSPDVSEAEARLADIVGTSDRGAFAAMGVRPGLLRSRVWYDPDLFQLLQLHLAAPTPRPRDRLELIPSVPPSPDDEERMFRLVQEVVAEHESFLSEPDQLVRLIRHVFRDSPNVAKQKIAALHEMYESGRLPRPALDRNLSVVDELRVRMQLRAFAQRHQWGFASGGGGSQGTATAGVHYGLFEAGLFDTDSPRLWDWYWQPTRDQMSGVVALEGVSTGALVTALTATRRFHMLRTVFDGGVFTEHIFRMHLGGVPDIHAAEKVLPLSIVGGKPEVYTTAPLRCLVEKLMGIATRDDRGRSPSSPDFPARAYYPTTIGRRLVSSSGTWFDYILDLAARGERRVGFTVVDIENGLPVSISNQDVVASRVPVDPNPYPDAHVAIMYQALMASSNKPVLYDPVRIPYTELADGTVVASLEDVEALDDRQAVLLCNRLGVSSPPGAARQAAREAWQLRADSMLLYCDGGAMENIPIRALVDDYLPEHSDRGKKMDYLIAISSETSEPTKFRDRERLKDVLFGMLVRMLGLLAWEVADSDDDIARLQLLALHLGGLAQDYSPRDADSQVPDDVWQRIRDSGLADEFFGGREVSDEDGRRIVARLLERGRIYPVLLRMRLSEDDRVVTDGMRFYPYEMAFAFEVGRRLGWALLQEEHTRFDSLRADKNAWRNPWLPLMARVESGIEAVIRAGPAKWAQFARLVLQFVDEAGLTLEVESFTSAPIPTLRRLIDEDRVSRGDVSRMMFQSFNRTLRR